MIHILYILPYLLIALNCLSILFIMCCLVSAFSSSCMARAKEEEEFQTETV